MKYQLIPIICLCALTACATSSQKDGPVTPPDPLDDFDAVTMLQADVDSAFDRIDPATETISPLAGNAFFIGTWETVITENVLIPGDTIEGTATVRGEARVDFNISDSTLSIDIPAFYNVDTGEEVGNLNIPAFEIAPDADQEIELLRVRGPLEVTGGGLVPFEPAVVDFIVRGQIGDSETLDRGIFDGSVTMREETDISQPGGRRHVIGFFESELQALEVQ